MKVSELIAALQGMPQDAEVFGIFDGAARLEAELLYLSQGGYVCIAQFNDDVYATADRPSGAPTMEEELYWRTERNPRHSDESL